MAQLTAHFGHVLHEGACRRVDPMILGDILYIHHIDNMCVYYIYIYICMLMLPLPSGLNCIPVPFGLNCIHEPSSLTIYICLHIYTLRNHREITTYQKDAPFFTLRWKQ